MTEFVAWWDTASEIYLLPPIMDVIYLFYNQTQGLLMDPYHRRDIVQQTQVPLIPLIMVLLMLCTRAQAGE